MGIDNRFKFLLGKEVKAYHPITCYNPDPTFKIKEVHFDHHSLYVRGENTIWFSSTMIELVD